MAMLPYPAHAIIAPCYSHRGILRCGTAGPPGYTTAGQMILLSTPFFASMRDYQVWHSQSGYGLGPFGSSWTSLGTVESWFAPGPGTLYPGQLCGPVFTTCMAYASTGGYVNLYTRQETDMPRSRFVHYRLAIDDPCQFFLAPSYNFIGIYDEPEWAQYEEQLVDTGVHPQLWWLNP